jgi:septum formation protein
MPNTLLLASGSPRRKELLQKAGVSFEILVPDVDETPRRGESPKRMVARLSRDKALAAQAQRSDGWILAADTTVVSHAGKNLGKPADAAEARRMLKALQGKVHRVFTAYTIVHGKKTHTRVVETRVHIRKLSPQEQEAYLATGESMDKAGAYAAQGHGMILIEKIVGSYTNVVGLPVAEVMTDLRQLGFRP